MEGSRGCQTESHTNVAIHCKEACAARLRRHTPSGFHSHWPVNSTPVRSSIANTLKLTSGPRPCPPGTVLYCTSLHTLSCCRIFFRNKLAHICTTAGSVTTGHSLSLQKISKFRSIAAERCLSTGDDPADTMPLQ